MAYHSLKPHILFYGNFLAILYGLPDIRHTTVASIMAAFWPFEFDWITIVQGISLTENLHIKNLI